MCRGQRESGVECVILQGVGTEPPFYVPGGSLLLPGQAGEKGGRGAQ